MAKAAAKPSVDPLDLLDEIYKKIGENDSMQDVSDWLDTGYLPLNYAVSQDYAKGWPVGRITEIFGGESSGKTLLATIALIETQKREGLAFFEDFEHSFSISRGEKIGLSTARDKWIFKQPETGQEGFKMIDYIATRIAESGIERHITTVIDSVAAILTEEEAATEYGKENMRTNSSLSMCMSNSLKKLSKTINKTNMTLLLLNQTRDNPGVMFGDKKKTSGGNALKFYASVRVKLAKVGKEREKGEDGGDIIGEWVQAEIVKNKVGRPFLSCKWLTDFDHGINLERSHVRALLDAGKLTGPKGYVEFAGKKYREKELAEECRRDQALYDDLKRLFAA